MAEAGAPSQTSIAVARWRDKLIDAAVLFIPSALITQSISWVQGKLFAQPWQVLWVALPIAVLAFVAWRLLKPPTAQRINARFAIFLILYGSFFGIASASDMLVWKRVPVAGFAGEASRNWLLPITWGDWRYWVVSKAEPPPRFIVLLEDHHDDWDPALKRSFDATIIEAAVAGHAKGVFFDISYSRHSATDAVLCSAVAAAVAAKIPIITAYHLVPVPGTRLYKSEPADDAKSTPACLIEQPGQPVYRAHSMVFADVDNRVRSIPTTWNDAGERSALAVRIAQCMKPASECGKNDLDLPPGALLRFLPGSEDLMQVRGDAAIQKLIGDHPGAFADKFLLVGEQSKSDRFATPRATSDDKEEGGTPGTLIHAYGVAALLAPRYFQRPPAWFAAFVVIAACGVLALFASQKTTPKRLLSVAALVSVAVISLAAAAARFQMVWLDVIYALVALWLLLPLLLAYRRLAR